MRWWVSLTHNFNPSITRAVLDDFVWHVLSIVLDGFIVESSTDQSLSGENGIFRIGDGLSFSSWTDQSFSFFGEGNNWGCGSDTFGVLNNFWSLTFHKGNTGVGGSEIDTNNSVTFFGWEGWRKSISEDSSHHFVDLERFIIMASN